ncbi:MAG: hypothetical protein R3A79_04960 [Nannocystaceae bacterium]
MIRLTRALLTILTAMTLTLSGCSKSVEGESKRWESNSAKVTALAAQYPGFKGAIDAQKASAKEIFDGAAGLDGDAKIEKLSAANSALMAGFVGDLDRIEEKMKKLRESRAVAAAKAGDTSSLIGAKVAADDANNAIERVERLLKAGATDAASAKALTKKALDDLDAAQKAIDAVVAADKEKKDAAQAEKDAAKAEQNADKADAKAAADAEAAKVAPWKCGYCDAENPHDATNCNSCGAPRQTDDKKDAAK